MQNNESHESPDTGQWSDTFKDTLEMVRRTSRDSRFVIFALLTFTLMNVIVFLNGYESAWTKQRIALVREALMQDCSDNFQETSPRKWVAPWTTKYAADRNFLNCAELYRQFETLRDFYNNEILIIRVPVVGFRVDANWFAILSSLGFALLQGALVVALSREKRVLMFANSHEISKRARMQNFFPKWSALLIIWLPVIVAGIVYGNDWRTVVLGRDINMTLSKLTSVVGAIGVLICFVMACLATSVLCTLDKVRRRGEDSVESTNRKSTWTY